MSDTDLLSFIISRCRAEISVEINSHRNYYQTVEEYLDDLQSLGDDAIPADVLDEMVARDTIVSIQFYPETPIGFYVVRHYDLRVALEMAANILSEPCS